MSAVLFRVLGPIEVLRDGHAVPVLSARDRVVLAMLLLNADRLTSVEVLIDALWERPPPSAKAQLHNSISKLRRRAGLDGLIVSRPFGYEFRLGPHELDLLEFRRLAEAGRLAAEHGDHESAAETLSLALSLWRGPALADVAQESMVAPREGLHEERAAAAEAKLDAELALGRHDDVLRQVTLLLTELPYREGLWQRRMLALVGAGRRADALAAYRQLRRRLVDELGVEPGPSLRELERRILRGEVVTAGRASACLPTPRQLPPAITVLTGRDGLLTAIGAELGRRVETAPPPVVLTGPGGVGKTALAVAVGHRLATAFPDGQLYGELRGSHERPADPHAVIGRFLHALGVDGRDVPADRDEQVALYRSLLAGKRVLVVLDDAAGEAQVRPLLPAGTGCRSLITSRRQLDALVAAVRWTIPVLAPQDGLALLAGVVGPDRVAAEPAAASAIVRLCAGLPLAVSVAAARLAVRPLWTLEEFRQRLARERGRLDELSVGDLDVRASIGLSYRELGPPQRQLLRRLGLLDAPDWPAWVADALTGAPAADLLDALTAVHLVEQLDRDAVGQRRFRLHDLVAAFANERAEAEDTRSQRLDAVSRVLRGWLGLAAEADELIPHHLPRPSRGRAAPTPPDAAKLARDAPVDWFEAERHSLVSAVDQARRIGDAELAGSLALRLAGFLALRSYDDDLDATLRGALSDAREDGSPNLLVALLGALFIACMRRGRHAELVAVAAEEATMAGRLGDPEATVRALTHAGMAASQLGRLADSVDRLEQAVTAARRPGIDRRLLRDSLDSLAFTHLSAGHPHRALPLLEEALALDDEPPPSARTALQLYHHGAALTAAGQLADAERVLIRAQRMCHDLGGHLLSAYLQQALADIDIRLGRWQRAGDRLEQALLAHQRLGGTDGLAETLRSTGDLAAARQRWADAVGWLQRALDTWRRAGAHVEVARTLARLERAYTAIGDEPAAAACRQECRTLLAELELDESCLRPAGSG